jgi:two-component system, OmpR family, response regulator
MRILVLEDDRPDPATIGNALRFSEIEAALGPPARHSTDERRYTFARWTLDPATRDLFGSAGRRAELTSTEFDLLLLFLRQPGQALSRAELTRALRGRAWDYFDRTIDTLVARLRKKIDTLGAPSLVRSVRGKGYVFCAAVAREAISPGPACEERAE